MKYFQIKNILFFILTSCLFLQSTTATAANQRKYRLTENAQEQLTLVQVLISDNKNQKALAILNMLLTSVTKQSYDEAVTYQTLGYVYSTLDKQQEAIQAFTKAINFGALPKSIVHELHYVIAQLLIHQAQYEQGLKYLTKWFQLEKKPSAQGHFLAATAYYHLENYKQLIYQLRNALKKRNNAPASWYELLLAGYYESRQSNKAAELMEKMLYLFPEKNGYWMQLAGLYMNIKQERKALAIMELAYSKGALSKHSELMQLARTYLYMEMPYKAADVLSSEIDKGHITKDRDSMKLLADSWILCRENDKGIDVLSEAANTFGDTELYYRLGQLYVGREQWKEAIDVLNKAKNEPDFQFHAETYLLLGIAAFQIKDNALSFKALNQALAFDNTKEKAQQWLAQIKK